MENLLQINDARQADAAPSEGNINGSMFLVNEFRYKCTANKEGNVDEVIFTDPFASDYNAEEMRKLGAPQDPRYADQFGNGKPADQVGKIAGDPTGGHAELEKVAQKPTPCR